MSFGDRGDQRAAGTERHSRCQHRESVFPEAVEPGHGSLTEPERRGGNPLVTSRDSRQSVRATVGSNDSSRVPVAIGTATGGRDQGQRGAERQQWVLVGALSNLTWEVERVLRFGRDASA